MDTIDRKKNRDYQLDLESIRNERFVLIMDLEATCKQEGGNYPPEEMEAIQVGAVIYDTEQLEVVDTFREYVKPTVHTQLTDFCTELTGVRQKDVDNAELFPVVFDKLMKWASRYRKPEELLTLTWGNYDCNQFLRDSERHGFDLPEGYVERHINLSYVSAKQNQVPRKKRSLGRSVEYYGRELVGNQHDALDDALSVAQLMPQILYGKGYRADDRYFEPGT